MMESLFQNVKGMHTSIWIPIYGQIDLSKLDSWLFFTMLIWNTIGFLNKWRKYLVDVNIQIYTFRNAVNALNKNLYAYFLKVKALLSANFNFHINGPEVIQDFRTNWHIERQIYAKAIGWNIVKDLL